MMFWWTIQRWWAVRYKLRLLIHGRRKPFEGPIAEPMAAAMLHIRPMLADNVTMNNPLLERLRKDNG